MKVNCAYCNSLINDTDEKCPNCGATNQALKRIGDGVPKTIDELKMWYKERNLPPEETTRFFIGKNITEPRAFGIYYDESKKKYVVYKNKDTGERAVRYEGKDEVHAVNELYIKLKEEILNQKKNKKNNKNNKRKWQLIVAISIIAVFFLSMIFLFISSTIHKDNKYYSNYGYYKYKDTYYLYQNELYKCVSIENNDWEIANLSVIDEKNILQKENYIASDIDTEVLPLTLDFNKSGFYTTGCKNGYYINNDIYYHYYKSNWYNYIDGVWKEVETKDVDKNITKTCIEPNEYYHHLYKEEWPIDDFKNSGYLVPKDGYYKKDGKYYYYYNDEWYIYINKDGWKKTKYNGDFYDYYYSYDYKDTNKYSDFYESDNYKESHYSGSSSSSSSWDSSSNWSSSDSWDSGSTDWSSDW